MKKNYVVSVKDPEDWRIIHDLLTQDVVIEDNIPTRACECTDKQEQNLDRATYLLHGTEVNILKSNDKIKYVELDTHFHPKVLSELQLKLTELRRAANRFSSTSKVYRQAKDSSDGISPPDSFTHGNAPTPYTTVNVSEKDRVPYSITRTQDYSDDFAYDDPAITEPRPTFASYSENYKEFYPSNYAEWYTQKSIKRPSEIKNVNIQYENDGSDIDIVIVDDGVWLGHPEFVNSDGTRQVKDIIIDGPFHIDPEAFAIDNPHGHTTTMVMGVKTPTDASAKSWWTDPSKRSAKFQSIGTLSDAGLSANYTLTGVNGSNTAYANIYPESATHGTSCAGVAYGNTFGHAFNSNKWTIYYAGYDQEGLISSVNMYTALKLFHKHKPVNNTYGTKNPTLLNFSIQAPVLVFYYGLDSVTFNVTSSWSWKWRSSTGSFTGINVSNQGTAGALSSVPPFLRTSPYLTFYEDDGFGLVGSFNGETSLMETLQVKSAMEDLIQEPGVFAFVASGNQNQKIVNYSNDTDDDYNNWVSPDGGITKYYCNRGWFVDLLQDASNESPVFAVGATDANKVLDANDSLYKERLTFFSARGSRIDIYAPGDDVLTAAGEPDTSASSGPHFYPRYDGNSNGSVGTTKAYASLGVDAYDSRFNGTSCATPIACGWFATILQNRRNWTPLKLKNYIKNSILNQSTSTFYHGVESTSGTDTNHYDLHTLEGGEAKILYNALVPSIEITSHPQSQTLNENSVVTFSVTATQNSTTGTLSYQWQRSTDGGSTWNNLVGKTSSSYFFVVSSSDNENKYRVLVSGTGGVDDIYSNIATLTINSNPIDITLTSTSFDENISDNAIVATISTTDPDPNDTFTYSLVGGDGDTDNNDFIIDGDKLKINSSPDYETKSSYSIRIQTTDSGGLTYGKQFTLNVNDINEAPSSITLTSTSFDENIAPGTTVAIILATDPDSGDTFTYSLVGGPDESYFTITGNELKIVSSPDYETKSSYGIIIKATDSGGLTYEDFFTLNVNNLNESPTDITLSPTSFDENIDPGTVVATISATDPDIGDTLTYTLVSGDGDTDNTSFTIDGDKLKINSSPNYETKNSYIIRIRATDFGGLTYEKSFTLSVNNLNEAPINIELTSTSFSENIVPGTAVATISTTDLDPNDTTFTYSLVPGDGSTDNDDFIIDGNELKINFFPDYETKNSYSIRIRATDSGGLTREETFTLSVDIGQEFTYALVSGTGDADNASFTIAGNELKIISSPNYETKSSYSIRIRTTDSGGLTYEKSFTLSVNNLNEAPINIELTSTSFSENIVPGTVVATISATDPDIGDTLTYSLVAGDGDTDNTSFTIDGDKLKINSSPNYETKNSYSIRIRATDSGGLTSEETFTLSVSGLNEAPTDITLSPTSFSENIFDNTTVATISATDPDIGDTLTYTLVSGTGDTDNASFTIDGDKLKINSSPNYETKNSYSIRIRATDSGGLTYEKSFTLSVEQYFPINVALRLKGNLILRGFNIF